SAARTTRVSPTRSPEESASTPPPLVVVTHGPAGRLLLALRMLLGKHLLFRPTRAAALLSPDALPRLLGGAQPAASLLVELLAEEPARQKAIHRLRARFLALHLEPARPVAEDDASGDLVHVLAALPARAHELLVEIVLTHAERDHAGRQGLHLFGR